MNDRLRQGLVVLLALLEIGSGWWVNSGVFETPVGEVSGSFDDVFTPAGITFSVWFVIWLGMLAYAVYQALPSQKERTLHRQIGWWAVGAMAATSIWSPVFAQAGRFGSPDFQPVYVWLSLLIMLGLLVSLARIFVILRAQHANLTPRDHWLVAAPFAAFFAWITVATIANVTTVLIMLGWSPDANGALWSTVMIAVATLLAAWLIVYSRSTAGIIAFTAVIVWALVGIYLGNQAQSALVGTSALIAAAVVAVVAGYRLVTRTPLPSTA